MEFGWICYENKSARIIFCIFNICNFCIYQQIFLNKLSLYHSLSTTPFLNQPNLKIKSSLNVILSKQWSLSITDLGWRVTCRMRIAEDNMVIYREKEVNMENMDKIWQIYVQNQNWYYKIIIQNDVYNGRRWLFTMESWGYITIHIDVKWWCWRRRWRINRLKETIWR